MRHLPRSRSRPGTVLIVVLVIITIVSLAAYHFTMAMESEHLATRNAGDQIKAEQAARSGVEALTALLEQPRSRRQEMQRIADREIELWSDQTENIGASFRIQLQQLDESGKLNLHSLLSWDRQYPGHAREALLRLPEMDDRTANRILDWIDSDDQARVPDGEQNARNSVPLSVGELAFLANETNQDTSVDSGRPRWLEFLTVHSAERNETFDGQQRIDLNRGDLRTLHEILTRAISIELADYIIRFRQYGMADALSSSTRSSKPTAVDFTIPAGFHFTSLGELIDSSVAVPTESGSKTVIVPSPIRLTGSTVKPLDRIFDRLTVKRDYRFIGRINIQTAPAEVLAAIPGMDQQTAQQIVQARGFGNQSRSVEQRYHHAIGILSSTAIDRTIVGEILDKVTVSGDVVKARITGRYEDRVPEFRCELIVDASDRNPRQILMRPLGTAGSESRQDFRTRRRDVTP